MDYNYKVSIISPIYNAGSLLNESLLSIVNQTYKNLEIILVNDCSDDGSFEVIDSFRRIDHRIKVVNNSKRLGAGNSRNEGIKHISGDYSIFLDADDIYNSDMIESMLTKAVETDSDIVVCGCDYLYKKKFNLFIPYTYSINQKALLQEGNIRVSDIDRNIFLVFSGWPWDKLIKTDIFMDNNIRFQDLRSSNDLSFVFSCLLCCNRVAVIRKPLVHHVKMTGTISATREKKWDCFYYALLELKRFLVQSGKYEKYEQDYINYALHFSLWNLYTLKEPARYNLFRKLKEEWLDSLDISGKPREYFYNPVEYKQLERIKKGRYKKQYLFDHYFGKIFNRISQIGLSLFISESFTNVIKYIYINIKCFSKEQQK